MSVIRHPYQLHLTAKLQAIKATFHTENLPTVPSTSTADKWPKYSTESAVC